MIMAYVHQNLIKSVITGICVILDTNAVFTSWKPVFDFYRSGKGKLYWDIKLKLNVLKNLAGEYQDIMLAKTNLTEIKTLVENNQHLLAAAEKCTMLNLIDTVLLPKLELFFLNIPQPLSRASSRDSLISASNSNGESDGYGSDRSRSSSPPLKTADGTFQAQLAKNIYETLSECNITAACTDFHRINLRINQLGLDDANRILIAKDTTEFSKKFRITQFYRDSGLAPFWIEYLLPRMSQAGTQSFSIPILSEFYKRTGLCLAEVPNTKRIEINSNNFTTTIKTSLAFHIHEITKAETPTTHIQFHLTLHLQMPFHPNAIPQLLDFSLDCQAANLQLLPDQLPPDASLLNSSHLPTLTQLIFHLSETERQGMVDGINTRTKSIKQ